LIFEQIIFSIQQRQETVLIFQIGIWGTDQDHFKIDPDLCVTNLICKIEIKIK